MSPEPVSRDRDPGRTGPRVAIVTGASQGIGAATALKLAERGFAVALAARRPMGLVSIENRIRDAGGFAFVAPTDITEPGQVTELVAETKRRFGPVGLLVNAAGAAFRAPLTATSEADFDRVLGVNLKGVFSLYQGRPARDDRTEKRPHREPCGNGRTDRGAPAHCLLRLEVGCGWASPKRARRKLRPAGISVFAVCPGSVDTESYRTVIPGAKPRSAPESVAEVIAWLGSEAPAAMSGSVVDAPG